LNIIRKDINITDKIINHIDSSLNKIKKLNIFLLMEKYERKIYKMYERDIHTITNSLLSFSSNCFNTYIKEKMKNLLQYTNDCDEVILMNRLNLLLYKHSLIK